MHCIARSNTIPDYNYLGEMNYICKYCGAKKFPDKTHFLCCHNGKVVLSQPLSFPQDLEVLFKGNYADRNVGIINWFTTLNVLHWLEIMLHYLSITIINFQLDNFSLHSFMA